MKKKRIILASSSKYRKTLLASILTDFECISPNIDETRMPNEKPENMVMRLAINKAKKVVGRVPGLGDMKTKADAEANIGKVANDVWKDYLQFKQTDPDAEQVKGWFKTNHGMDVEPDANANVDQDSIVAQAI